MLFLINSRKKPIFAGCIWFFSSYFVTPLDIRNVFVSSDLNLLESILILVCMSLCLSVSVSRTSTLALNFNYERLKLQTWYMNTSYEDVSLFDLDNSTLTLTKKTIADIYFSGHNLVYFYLFSLLLFYFNFFFFLILPFYVLAVVLLMCLFCFVFTVFCL